MQKKSVVSIRVRTADPMWLCIFHLSLCITQSIKADLKNKGTDQFLERLVSPCHSFSHFLLNSHLECRGSSSLLRPDWGGLSVSSPSGKREDTCGLRRWRKFLVLKFCWLSMETKLFSLFSPLNFLTELSLFNHSLYL